MVSLAGPLATINREPGQARKGAATTVDLGAGVWLVGFTSNTWLQITLAQPSNQPYVVPKMFGVDWIIIGVDWIVSYMILSPADI